ncbi:hypothetical protein BDW62DRAFT_198884 [Aspergillus aurantiobrunneus]
MSTEFVFVHVRDPKDALQLAKRSHIRAHVTRHQWKQYEERSQTRAPKKARKQDDKKDFQQQDLGSGDLILQDPPCARSITTPALPLPRPLGGLRGDPFRSYPVAWRPFLPQLVDHYLMSMAVDIPELDQPGNRGLLRTDWFPLTMSEPSLFLVIMLLAASHHASVQTGSTEMKMQLLSLRCEAIQAVNRSLERESSGVSDALIGAIAKMASYEAMYGNRCNYKIHMQGLQRAVELRGGLFALGLGGLLRRIVIWIDRNGSFLTGSALYFPDEAFAPGQPLPLPNPGHFLAVQ